MNKFPPPELKSLSLAEFVIEQRDEIKTLTDKVLALESELAINYGESGFYYRRSEFYRGAFNNAQVACEMALKCLGEAGSGMTYDPSWIRSVGMSIKDIMESDRQAYLHMKAVLAIVNQCLNAPNPVNPEWEKLGPGADVHFTHLNPTTPQ